MYQIASAHVPRTRRKKNFFWRKVRSSGAAKSFSKVLPHFVFEIIRRPLNQLQGLEEICLEIENLKRIPINSYDAAMSDCQWTILILKLK